MFFFFFFSSRRRHTRCALVTGVQTCALPISARVEVLAEALVGQGRLSDEIAVLTAHLQDDRFTEVMQQLIHQRGRLADLKAARGNVDRLVADIFALLRVDPHTTVDGPTAAAREEGTFDRAGLMPAMQDLSQPHDAGTTTRTTGKPSATPAT